MTRGACVVVYYLYDVSQNLNDQGNVHLMYDITSCILYDKCYLSTSVYIYVCIFFGQILVVIVVHDIKTF